MYTAIFLIIGFIVFITISILLASKITTDEFGQAGLMVLFFFVLVTSYFFSMNYFSGENYKEKYKYYEIEITALQDNIGTEGNRYCIRTEDKIYFAKKESNGNIKLGNLLSYTCEFTFDNENKIEAYTYRWKPEYQWFKYIFPICDLSDDKTYETDYIIHCPEGTVKTDFNVDLKN